MYCERLSKLFPLAAVLFFAAVTPAAAAFEMSWQDTLQSSPTWHRPTADMEQVATGATSYNVQSIVVDRSGVYHVDSDQPATEVPFHGYVFLYAGSFDPNQPLLNLVAGSEGGPDGTSPAHVAGILTAGAVYQVVTSSDDPQAGRFTDTVSGPGTIHAAGCAAHGGTPANNSSAVGLVGGRFCVTVTWKDDAGTTHTAAPVGFRSDSSAAFWFFSPANWELQVKVIDACSINNHLWVMASGTTHLDYQINVEDTLTQSSVPVRTYHSKAGSLRATVDTQAFDGCPARTARRR
jgi:hypothetical protein